MKYYIVSDIIEEYSIDEIYQSIYSAESKEDLYDFIMNIPHDYIYTESNFNKPLRSDYKTEASYKQALQSFAENLPKKIMDANDNLKREFYSFFEYCYELNIPCNETETKLIQEIEII